MACPYEDGARGPYTFDCLGFVREMFHESSGKDKDLIPEWGGVTADNGAHEAYLEGKEDWREVPEPEHESLVCSFNKDGFFVHIGIYLNGDIYHSSRGLGPSITSVRSFGHYGRLEFYVHR